MGIIHILDSQVANQIAAGEVIERPCSAIKEMIENSLDAHATNIVIEVENGGLDLIKISDDGDGMFKEDLPLSIERHATSKISKFNDVYSLNTFGFRGEALASLAVISRLKIRTGRSQDYPSNILISAPSASIQYSEGPPLKGTIIEARDLYYNVPARKKFIRSNNHETSLIYDLICKFALAFPNINFTYLNEKNVIFSSNQLNTVEEIMKYVYADNNKDEIIHVNKIEFYQKHSAEAWFFHPSITRNNRNQMIYFVNDRLIESKELNKIIEEAVYTLIPKGRFPICILKLYLPAFNIDVNVHPSKKIIKFKDITDWKDLLVNLIKENLWMSRLNVPLTLQHENKREDNGTVSNDFNSIKAQSFDFLKEEPDNIPDIPIFKSIDRDMFFENVSENIPKEDYFTKDTEIIDDKYFIQEDTTDYSIDIIEEQSAENLLQDDLENLQYIGQLNNTFILAQDKNNLYIIDQHTLHERILYEKFMYEVEEKCINPQRLLHPIEVHLNPIQEKTLVENIIMLSDIGFVFEKTNELTYSITEIPSILTANKNISNTIKDILDEIGEGVQHRSISTINEDKIITASCKAAVKANYLLNENDVKLLLKHLSRLKNAHTCPHGRPIIMNISMNELYLYFKRGSF